MVKTKLLHIAILSALSLPIMAHAATTQEQIQQKQQQIEANNVKINNYKTELVPYESAENAVKQVSVSQIRFDYASSAQSSFRTKYTIKNNSDYLMSVLKVEFNVSATKPDGNPVVGNVSRTSYDIPPGGVPYEVEEKLGTNPARVGSGFTNSPINLPDAVVVINNKKYSVTDGIATKAPSIRTSITTLQTQNQKLEQEIAELSSN